MGSCLVSARDFEQQQKETMQSLKLNEKLKGIKEQLEKKNTKLQMRLSVMSRSSVTPNGNS